MDALNRIKFLEDRLHRLSEIGMALSTEKDTDRLFEMILEEAKHITKADGRTLYSMNEEGDLSFEILRNDSMNTIMGGTSGVEIPYYPVHLWLDDQTPNQKNVSAYVALTGKTVNIKDAYEEEGYDFEGTINFDKKNGYRSKSFLTVPLKNHENEIIGVMQLINARNDNGDVIPFNEEMEEQVESLASQGAVALTNKRLVEELKILFEAFIKLIATAIDKKSEYTGGHCARVPVITMMLADAVAKMKDGKYKDFSMNDEERYELYLAAWLHDCGKVATPEFVVDKSTKLETIYDRVNEVETRFGILKRDEEIKRLKKELEIEKDKTLSPKDRVAKLELLMKEYRSKIKKLKSDLDFVKESNIGGEFMSGEKKDRIHEIADYKWKPNGKIQNFLSDDEVYNLTIPRGTLTPEERKVINDHIVVTIKMLEELPYPKHLQNVPEFAGGHHEKLDGTGYPKGLIKDDMSVQARIMAIADIFEALTAKDRPYKKGKTLSQAMRILGFMKDDAHIDVDLFEIFVKEKIYMKYAEGFLDPEQIDEVKI